MVRPVEDIMIDMLKFRIQQSSSVDAVQMARIVCATLNWMDPIYAAGGSKAEREAGRTRVKFTPVAKPRDVVPLVEFVDEEPAGKPKDVAPIMEFVDAEAVTAAPLPREAQIRNIVGMAYNGRGEVIKSTVYEITAGASGDLDFNLSDHRNKVQDHMVPLVAELMDHPDVKADPRLLKALSMAGGSVSNPNTAIRHEGRMVTLEDGIKPFLAAAINYSKNYLGSSGAGGSLG